MSTVTQYMQLLSLTIDLRRCRNDNLFYFSSTWARFGAYYFIFIIANAFIEYIICLRRQNRTIYFLK